MPREALPEHLQRKERLDIPLRDYEREAIRKAARINGYRPTVWARQVLLAAAVREVGV